ncbi:Glycosyltransferase involved in cell wall bisynthesis [Desulfurobacterium pacificum]|uniref:Glycosyltransferase involved in cell wall bisynthesis n=1 Tax=Desulfurobacterium pacificum TaxID=240166 RepID=A0ABY1NND6_9BACT|nr:glycosyltransferase family 4 protein [Desulfurobacterium pacificum]SMP14003.1 Glycosyltransferase involved in cell wall bisynthesis [Desulfurobacterium pacificum]
MNKKIVWFINEYAGSPKYGMVFRHYYLGKELVNLDYNVWIISANYSHLFYNYPHVKRENIDGINYYWIDVIKYPHAHSKKRVLKWFQFSTKLFRQLRFLPKPDYIYVSSPFLLPIVPAYFYSKKYKAKLIFEVRDIWPLTLVELGGYSWKHPFISFMRKIELFALKKSDSIVSVLFNFGKYLSDLGLKRDWHYIPNGVAMKDVVEEELPKTFISKIPKNKFIVAYTGTIGWANSLDTLLGAAEILRDRKDIAFVIVGKGKEKQRLISIKEKKMLNNVVFLEPITKGQILAFLKNFVDITYVGLRRKKLFKYGVSPNKIFDYMLAKKPIIHAIDVPNDLVSQAGCGISVKAESPKAVADAILKLYEMPKEKRERLGENGYSFLLKNHTYEKLAEKLVKEVLA